MLQSVTVNIKKKHHDITYVFLSPSFHGPLRALLSVDPPVLGQIGRMSQTQEIQVDKKPLGFFLHSFGLTGLKVADIEFGSVHNLSVRLLKEIEHEFQQRDQAVVFLDASDIVFLYSGRLFPKC